MTTATVTGEVDAIVIGAGFAGMYMNYRLRDQMGLDVQVFEAGDDVEIAGILFELNAG